MELIENFRDIMCNRCVCYARSNHVTKRKSANLRFFYLVFFLMAINKINFRKANEKHKIRINFFFHLIIEKLVVIK